MGAVVIFFFAILGGAVCAPTRNEQAIIDNIHTLDEQITSVTGEIISLGVPYLPYVSSEVDSAWDGTSAADDIDKAQLTTESELRELIEQRIRSLITAIDWEIAVNELDFTPNFITFVEDEELEERRKMIVPRDDEGIPLFYFMLLVVLKWQSVIFQRGNFFMATQRTLRCCKLRWLLSQHPPISLWRWLRCNRCTKFST